MRSFTDPSRVSRSLYSLKLAVRVRYEHTDLPLIQRVFENRVLFVPLKVVFADDRVRWTTGPLFHIVSLYSECAFSS